MKIVAYYAIHYGKEWLYHSIRSVVDYVDEVRVYYTESPSHGHGTRFHNPDTANDLLDAVRPFGVVWSESKKHYRWEGDHRDYAINDCIRTGADIILVVDHDEIWEPEHLKQSLQYVKDNEARWYRVGMRHFWRSVNYVCNDPAMPVRFHKPHSQFPNEAYIPGSFGLVNHFGYAQRPAIVEYKQEIHGHKAEWRQNWYREKFLQWPPVSDVHPTCTDDFWIPEYFDKRRLVDLIGDHPYYNMEYIQ